ncbi:glycoside hydrolase family 5 protein [Piedraia hortae CBS 480.64]|uniref:glucan 1,3-beta-glucosidase n=1 Tax=Piedraia hortae CBS 480.64 TaxID=1314780 RepID=A0A6A7BS75_9PEZI|nr:glycoside hydrolase family 5 protein [Piedraia hortae CBS 480.64]
MLRTAVAALALLATANAAPSKRSGATGGINWGKDTVRGVNLGGWLVLEPYITPSIFKPYDPSSGVVDEYTLCQKLGKSECYNTLKPHWDNWVTLADFQKIAKSGFNIVRLPVGYWAYDDSGSPYSKGAAPYVDKAINWARQVGVKVIVDLHGVPGSQNGFDNSGQRLSTPGWTQGDNVQRTLDILKIIEKKYGDSQYDDVVAAINLINEPLTPNIPNGVAITKQYMRDAYGNLRDVSQSRVVTISDGFQPVSSYNGWMTPSDNNVQNVVMDHHEYQCFTNELVAMKPWQHRQYVCNAGASYAGGDKWTIIGEWSAAMTDCAAALNGYGIGARYDGTYPGSTYHGSCDGKNSIDQWSESWKNDVRGFIEAQMEVYEKRTNGWIFWNFKTEGAPDWDAFRLIDAGIFPQPLSDRKFGAICTN